MKRFLLTVVCLLLACNLNCKREKRPIPSPISSPAPTSAPLPPEVRKEVIYALTEQVLNDPVVHLKYWHWGGHSTNDLDEYIWMQYRNTKWKVTIQEAQVLKSRAIEILDSVYKRKAGKKFFKK